MAVTQDLVIKTNDASFKFLTKLGDGKANFCFARLKLDKEKAKGLFFVDGSSENQDIFEYINANYADFVFGELIRDTKQQTLTFSSEMGNRSEFEAFVKEFSEKKIVYSASVPLQKFKEGQTLPDWYTKDADSDGEGSGGEGSGGEGGDPGGEGGDHDGDHNGEHGGEGGRGK